MRNEFFETIANAAEKLVRRVRYALEYAAAEVSPASAPQNDQACTSPLLRLPVVRLEGEIPVVCARPLIDCCPASLGAQWHS